MADTLAVLVDRYVRAKQSQGRLNALSAGHNRSRLNTLVEHFGADRPAADLTREDVEEWLGSLVHMKASSRSTYLSSAKTFTRWASGRGCMPLDPCGQIDAIRRPRTVPRALSAEQVRAIFEACEDARDRAIIWLMVGCGLRRIEVARLDWGDVNLESRTMVVNGKNSDERELPLPATVYDALSTLPNRSGPVIRSQRHARPMHVVWIGARVGHLMEAAGVRQFRQDGRSGHALRHTAASDVLDQCGDLRVVQEMLGHAHLTSTAIYLRRANLGKMREAMEGRSYGS